jgi:transposase
MIYLGLDVHKGFSRMGMFNPADGELQDLGNVRNEPGELAAQLAQVPGPKAVVLEAGRQSHHLASVLEQFAERVWVVDPAVVRKLQQGLAKTDRHDATAIAFWAAKGALKPLWRPDARTLDLRELTGGKTVLTRLAVKVRVSIRTLLARHGYECPHRDLLGARAQAWLNQVELSGYAGWMLAALRELLPILQGKADECEAQVGREAQTDPQAQRLMTIPGIGPFLGLALAAEIGDARRFPMPAHLRGYSGLTPKVVQSSQRDARGPITKRGNRWLRYAAVLAAQRMAVMRQADPKLKRTFLTVAFKHGRNPAKVAYARRLLDLIHHLLTHQEDYQAPVTRPSVKV